MASHRQPEHCYTVGGGSLSPCTPSISSHTARVYYTADGSCLFLCSSNGEQQLKLLSPSVIDLDFCFDSAMMLLLWLVSQT